MIKFRATWLKMSGDMTLVSGERLWGDLTSSHHSAWENCRLWRHCKFPFQKQSLPFLRHLENFWPVIEGVSIEKKEDCNPGRTQHSNTDLSYPNLSVWNFGNSTCPMERYIPVVQTRLKPPRVWLLFMKAGYKRAVLRTTILSHGKGISVRLTEITGLVKVDHLQSWSIFRNSPFHLM